MLRRMPKKGIRRGGKNQSIAVLDFETDPFEHGRIPKPFAAGVMLSGPNHPLPEYRVFWGADCVDICLDWIASIKTPLVIYAHNGGKFDFHFLLSRLDLGSILCIKGRIVKANYGIHEFRDSWPIIPMPLASANSKLKIDYNKFEEENREEHKAEILTYLQEDCRSLHEIVTAFIDRFGLKLTAPSAAMTALKKLHPQPPGNLATDKLLRPFYFGGRVQCFETGVIDRPLKVYDVNSMYPHVMKNFQHPKGHGYVTVKNVTLDSDGWIKGFHGYFYFAEVEGINRGAIPLRGVRQIDPLDFDTQSARFLTNSHELRAAKKLGLFTVRTIHTAHIARETQNFAEFVDTYAAEKVTAKKEKNKTAEVFAKLMLNSAYGRFGINPYGFREYLLQDYGTPCEEPGYMLDTSIGMIAIWSRPKFKAGDPDTEPPFRSFENVAIAASVTAAARSVLMRALHASHGVVYCDTDSIICEEIGDVPRHDYELGAWKLDAEGDRIAIAGKKLYTLLKDGEEVKSASKGVRLTAEQIEDVSRGTMVTWRSEAPSFSISGPTRFTTRRVQLTSRKR